MEDSIKNKLLPIRYVYSKGRGFYEMYGKNEEGENVYLFDIIPDTARATDDPEATALAKFIVLACNSHGELIDSLEKLITSTENETSLQLSFGEEVCQNHLDNIGKAKDVIAKLKG